jgi:hypothetical protein
MSDSAVDTELLLREVIDAWPFIRDLPEYAQQMHGYGDSNGGFGVTYSGDLDEYDQEVKGLCIPTGMVQVYGYWGAPNGYDFLVAEKIYLQILAKVLSEKGYQEESSVIRNLAESRA